MNTVVGVIIESIVATLLFIVAVIGITNGYPTAGWIGVFVSIAMYCRVMFVVSTGRVHTPKGLTAGFSLYNDEGKWLSTDDDLVTKP